MPLAIGYLQIGSVIKPGPKTGRTADPDSACALSILFAHFGRNIKPFITEWSEQK